MTHPRFWRSCIHVRVNVTNFRTTIALREWHSGRRNYDGILSTSRPCRIAGDARCQEIRTAIQNTIPHDYTVHGKYKKYPSPLTFIGISAMRADFCMKFYATNEQQNTHITARFVEICLEIAKLCCFNKIIPPFCSVRASRKRIVSK